MSLVVRAGTALSLASLGLVLRNLRTLRVPDGERTSDEHVAVLLPVRNEESCVVECLRSILRSADWSAGRVDVLVLDDGSTDATAALVRDVAAHDPRVSLIDGLAPPPGWLGKPWACHQLARSAPADAAVLVFIDADVTVAEPCLAATVGLLRSADLDLVCPYPRQLAATWSERLVQPLLQWSWMSTLPLRLAERSARPSLGAANGQLLCVDVDAYRRAGGHEAVRDQVLEDMALLRAFKATGARGVVADGSSVAACRMYDGWPELRDGYAKSLWSAFGSPAGAAGTAAVLALAYVVPPVAALRGSRTGALGYLAAVAGRALVARRTGARLTPDVWLHPVSVLLLDGLLVDSFRRRARGELRWKGRPVSVPTTAG